MTVETPPPTTDDELDRLRSPDEAHAIILAQTTQLPVESVPIDRAAGRVLAEAIVATENHPLFPASTMDGFAVVAGDSSPWREVIGDQTAGFVLDVEVTNGTAVRITTGAPLPRGADAVIPVEETEPTEDHVIIHQHDVTPGQFVRPIGSDLKQGEGLLAAGTVLGPAEIGLLAGLGITPVPVRHRARVSVLSTGDELVEPDESPGPGQIRDSNRFSLVAALVADGAEVVWSGKAPDQPEPLRRFLQQRIADSDLVVTSGGVSMGELDLVKGLLGELATVHFRKLFMKPGKPLNFATAGGADGSRTLIFGLPGNPVSALVGYHVLLRPALRLMAGLPDDQLDHPKVRVTLFRNTTPSDRIEYQRAVVYARPDGRLAALPTGPQASSRLASFVGANALLIVPPREGIYRTGQRLDALLLGPVSTAGKHLEAV